MCIEKPAKIRIKYKGSDYRKVGIYGITGSKGSYYFIDNLYNRDSKEFQADTWKMGSFFLVRDDSPPTIRFRNRRKLKRNRSIRIYVRDMGTGVDLESLYLKVDGRNVIWDYDPDHSCVEILPHNRIWKKGKHGIVIQIKDRAGNKSKKKSYFYFI